LNFADTVVLGTVAGLAIFLGLPIAKVRTVRPKHLAFLNALAIGILLFLFVDISTHALEPVEGALKSGASDFAQLLALLVGGFVIGLLSLVYYARRFMVGAAGTGRQLAIMIATGIGLHNFSEGLAIGNSAQRGELALALTLVVGFGLHNVTEAFGIAAPVAGGQVGWGTLALAGAIAGGPNFFGTILGYAFRSEAVSVLFLSLAAGALVFIVGELFAVGRRLSSPAWNGWGVVVGFFAGVLTDFVLIAAGA
jgi:ZIP family zinc transporter